jgi:hypothetical protein
MTSPFKHATVRRRLLQDDDEEIYNGYPAAVLAGTSSTPPRADSSLRDLLRPSGHSPLPSTITRPRAPLSASGIERSPGRISTPAQHPSSSSTSSAHKSLPSSGIAWLERERRRTETRLQAANEHNTMLQALLRQCYSRLGRAISVAGLDESIFDRFKSESSVRCPLVLGWLSHMCFLARLICTALEALHPGI